MRNDGALPEAEGDQSDDDKDLMPVATNGEGQQR